MYVALRIGYSILVASAGMMLCAQLPLLEVRQLCLGLWLWLQHFLFDECKIHLCFEFISHAILSILYPYSCKLITFPLNLVLWDFLWKASDLVRKYAKCFQKES